MRVRVESVQYADIPKKYKDVLDKYNLEKVFCEVENEIRYYITINTLEELFNLKKELQQDLIIYYEVIV